MVIYTKCYGITRGIYNSLAIYVYSLGKRKCDVIDIFNGWADACGYKANRIEEVLILLNFIRKLKKIRTEDLGKALIADNFINLIPPE